MKQFTLGVLATIWCQAAIVAAAATVWCVWSHRVAYAVMAAALTMFASVVTASFVREARQ